MDSNHLLFSLRLVVPLVIRVHIKPRRVLLVRHHAQHVLPGHTLAILQLRRNQHVYPVPLDHTLLLVRHRAACALLGRFCLLAVANRLHPVKIASLVPFPHQWVLVHALNVTLAVMQQDTVQQIAPSAKKEHLPQLQVQRQVLFAKTALVALIAPLLVQPCVKNALLARTQHTVAVHHAWIAHEAHIVLQLVLQALLHVCLVPLAHILVFSVLLRRMRALFVHLERILRHLERLALQPALLVQQATQIIKLDHKVLQQVAQCVEQARLAIHLALINVPLARLAVMLIQLV